VSATWAICIARSRRSNPQQFQLAAAAIRRTALQHRSQQFVYACGSSTAENGIELIVASTCGIRSDDVKYLETERAIQWLTSRRDALAREMKDALNGMAQDAVPRCASGTCPSAVTRTCPQLVREGRELLLAAEILARY
jgi:hypothetical protein